MAETVQSQIAFHLNGKLCTVNNCYPPTMSLNEYIREVAGLTGTKVMCRSGNCGCCTVSVKYYDITTKTKEVKAIVSCLCPMYSCDGWEITTTEGIGNKQDGFHPVQEKIADLNGSQCGWCTPGMVMSMYSFLQENASPTKAAIEKVVDGNVCRCTGFRSIVDAFQTFSVSDESKDDIVDLEDLTREKICEKPCAGSCTRNRPLELELGDSKWLKPTSLTDLLTTVDKHKGSRTLLVAGNTTSGFTPDIVQHDVYIDIKGVKELFEYSAKDSVYFGACVTLKHMMDALNEASLTVGYNYCSALAQHIEKVASTPIRNVGTWAGNLMARHDDHTFVSDIFTIFTTVGAKVVIGAGISKTWFSLEEFVELDMRGKVILSMSLPRMNDTDVVKTFKIMPRGEFSLAYVNAGFRFNIGHDGQVKDRPTIVFGGINSTMVHANKTEEFLAQQTLDAKSMQEVMAVLSTELEPDNNRHYGSAEYRKNLALSLLYKFVLSVLRDKVDISFRSGGFDLERPLSIGTADFETNKSTWPVSQPIAKSSARIQASGEAIYIPDMKQQELHAAFVLTTVGNAKIQKIDPGPALKLRGVVRFISVADIPPGGQNNCLPGNSLLPYPGPEEIFRDDQVLYSGQAVGLIVAETNTIAQLASKKVAVEYSDVKRPVIDLREAISREMFHSNQPLEIKVGDPDMAFKSAHKVIAGEVALGTQYHLHMETQSCLSIPDEDGFQVYPSTQWPDCSQRIAAQVLGLKNTDIRVDVRRLGGSFGAKASRNFKVTAACVLASHITKRPVKLHMDLQSNMAMIGKRFPYLGKYKVAVDKTGRLLAVDITYFCDCGHSGNESTAMLLPGFADNAYYCENWRLKAVLVKTNTPANTFCRAPGSTPAIFITETMLEHVAQELEMNPLEIKFKNLYQPGQVNPLMSSPIIDCPITSIFNQLITSANVRQRIAEMKTFNETNRWKKKGISVVPMKFDAVYFPLQSVNVIVSVYNGDGSVSISHGGVEMGQGVDTKVMQVCAYELGIGMEYIKIRPTDTHSNANSQISSGSVCSELCCMGVMECCKILKARLDPFKNETLAWPGLIRKAFEQGVDLTAKYWNYPKHDGMPTSQYQAYGVTCTEVELDVLTGQNQVTRVDMLYDCGQSLNPSIDIGQAQGAFVMGLGLYLLEDIKYDPETGQSYNNDLWNYHVPTVKDIPIDFRISFLQNTSNPKGVLNSKIVGEPPLCMSCSALFALKSAIAAARKDAGCNKYFQLDAPCTVDTAQQMCLNDTKQFKL